MKNIDQIRSSNAHNWERFCNSAHNNTSFTPADTAKLPAMILSNGLLGTLAYAMQEGKPTRSGINAVMDEIAAHLVSPEVGFPELHGATDAKSLSTKLAMGEALTLQRATSESLAYLSYLKRFSKNTEA